jgi:hypothetical protein
MLPTEIMKDKLITRRHLKKMRKAGGISRWMANKARIWKFIWSIYPNLNGFIPWDVFLVTYLTNPEAFTCDDNIPTELKLLKNNTSSLFRKKYKKYYKEFLVSSYNLNSAYRSKYCYQMQKNHLDQIVDQWTLFK